MPEVLTDEDLMVHLRSGDESALAEIYDRYAARIFGLALRLTGDREASEEVVQDVFMRLWQHAESFNNERSTVKTWLLAIARNRSIDMLRTRARRPQTLPLIEGAAAGTVDVAVRAEHNILVDDIKLAFHDLPDALRELLERSYFLGQSHGEIAAAMGIPLGTVKTRIRRALEQVRDLVFGEGGNG